MGYRLREGQEAFQVVDGDFAGKTFNKDVQYEIIPGHEAHRFESVLSPISQPEAVPPPSPVPDSEPLSDTDKPAKKGVKSNA